jgi:hypothetical protein
VDRQIAGELEVLAVLIRNAPALERDVRELLDVEKIAGAQVRVAPGSRVSIVAASMRTSTSAFEGLDSSITTVPSTPGKRPFTVEIIRCRTPNSTSLWAGSIFQVVRAGVVVVVLMSVLLIKTL